MRFVEARWNERLVLAVTVSVAIPVGLAVIPAAGVAVVGIAVLAVVRVLLAALFLVLRRGDVVLAVVELHARLRVGLSRHSRRRANGTGDERDRQDEARDASGNGKLHRTG